MFGDHAAQGVDIKVAGRSDHDLAARQQRHPQLVGRGVERQWRMHQHPPVRAALETSVAGQRDHVTVPDRDALRGAGGAGGVHDVGKVLRIQRHSGFVVRLAGAGVFGVGVQVTGAGDAGVGVRGIRVFRVSEVSEVYEHDVRAVQRRCGSRPHPVGEQHRATGLGQHQPHPLSRRPHIHRHIRRTRRQHRQLSNNQLHRTFHQHTDTVLRPYAEPAQPPRQPARPLVQLPIAQRRILRHHRRGVRRTAYLLGKGIRHGAGDESAAVAGVVPLHQDLVPLGLGQHRQVRHDTAGVVGDRGQQHLEVPGQPLDRGRVEEIGVVLDDQVQRIPARQELQHEVETRGRAGQVVLGDPQPADLPRAHHRVLKHDERLYQRVPAGVPLRLQLLDQPVEGHLVVRERLHDRLPYLREEVAECFRSVHTRPQHDRVDEEPGQVLQLRPVTAGGRAADRDVPLAAVPGQQHLQRSDQRHEQSGPVCLPHRGQPPYQPGR